MKNKNDLFALIEKAIEGELSQEDAERLDTLVANDAEARKAYLDYTHLHACLHWRGSAANPPDQGTSVPLINEIVEPPRAAIGLPWYAMGAGLLLVAIAFFLSDWGSGAESPGRVVATVAETKNCSWGLRSISAEVGAELAAGDLSLVSGIATLRFESGAELTLEAPAELEIIDAMHCVLKNGTIVANVPPSAHGFTVNTETAQLIDRGTSFGVSVNREKRTTNVNVFDGIVDVEQRSSSKQRRLVEGERSVVEDDKFEVFDSDEQGLDADLELHSAVQGDDDSLITITCGDGTGTDGFVRSTVPDGRRFTSLLVVSNSGWEKGNLKAYVGFDLTKLSGREVVSARLQLQNQRFDGPGFASFVPDATFAVYGITTDSGKNWLGNTITWNDAPANLHGGAAVDPAMTKLLGKFVVPQGVYDGFVSIDGEELSTFLSEKHGQFATIIIVRETVQTQAGGLRHAFAGRKTPEASPPTLLIEVE